MSGPRRLLDDDGLRLGLERRVAAAPLTDSVRTELLRAVRVQLTTRGQRPWRPWLRWSLTAGAAAAVLVLLVTPLLLRGPRTTPPPGASVRPASSAASTPAASVEPTEQPISAPEIFSAQQLSDMIGDPQWIGTVALAQAELGYMMTGEIGCRPPDPCRSAVLGGVSGHNVVAIGWRPALEGEGTRYVDDSGVHWVVPVNSPAEPGVGAFKVLSDSVEYLGPVVDAAGETVWTVADLRTVEQGGPSDEVYAVAGWLVETSPVPCPGPPDLQSSHDLSYYCGGSWITADAIRTVTHESANLSSYRLVFDDGLHIQHGAYDEFAVGPSYDDLGAVPRYATYLIRPAGCPPNVMGDCPVWRMVGRLDLPATPPPPTPDTATPPSPATTPTADATRRGALIDASAAGWSFERPQNWVRWLPNEHDPMTSGPMIYLSTDPLLRSCAVLPDYSPNPPDSGGYACSWPLASLSPGGVFVEWMNERLLAPMPTDGEPIEVNGAPTYLQIEQPGACGEIGADETMSLLIRMGQPTPLSNVALIACLRGPDLATLEQQVRDLLTSIRQE